MGHALVAQRIEHIASDDAVGGSSPSEGANEKVPLCAGFFVLALFGENHALYAVGSRFDNWSEATITTSSNVARSSVSPSEGANKHTYNFHTQISLCIYPPSPNYAQKVKLMPKSYKKKPLGAWPENKKHQVSESLSEEGAESQEGHEPDPEKIEDKTVLERAKEMGLYQDSTEDDQEEVNLAEEEDEDIEEENQN